MVSIVSVPHTGTQFTEKLLSDMGFEVRCAHVHSTHPAQDARAWIGSGERVVIPWREPELARISALNRGQKPRPISEFVDILVWAKQRNVHLFDVEPDDREAELAGLREFLGCEHEITTDWVPVNSSKDVTGLKAAYIQ